MVPAVLMASERRQDFVFLDMTRAGFDLSDRGVTGRAAPGRARRLCLDRARHLPRRRGRACRSPCPRRRGQGRREPAADLHLLAPRRRRGPPHRLATAHRPAAMPSTWRCRSAAMRGTWTVAIHTDPKEPAVASQMFLVEDFVPDRIEFDLTTRQAGDRRRRDRQRHRRRPLPLWRAGRRACARRRGHALDQARMGRASTAIPSASPTSRKAKRRASR